MTTGEPRTARLAIVAAFRREVTPLLKNRHDVVKLGRSTYGFQWRGEPVVLGIAGAGAENAYRSACDLALNYSPAALISIGFAGGLKDSLRVGDLVVAAGVVEESTGVRFSCQMSLLPIASSFEGVLLSTAKVVCSAGEKSALASRWGAVAVDMESGGVARAAFEMGLPFGALKSITDASDESIAIDFQRCRSEDGGFSSWKIVREGLGNPRGLRDLWKLAGSSRRAAGILAVALASS